MAIIYPNMYRNTGKDHTRMMKDPKKINISTQERIISVMTGSFLLYRGLRNLLKQPLAASGKILAGSWLFARGASGHCPVYEKTHTDGVRPESINVRQTFVVEKSRTEVYQFWRQLENLPLFMKHLVSVEQTSPRISVWKARFASYLPPVSWKAEIVKERENELIGWGSVEGSAIENAGKVAFKDAENGGTEVSVIFSYHAPVGGLANGIAKLFTPLVAQAIQQDVKQFKQFIESGQMEEKISSEDKR